MKLLPFQSFFNYLTISAVLLALAIPGCTRISRLQESSSDIEIELTVEPDPPLFGRPCQLTVALHDHEKTPITGARIQIKGDMAHAGMVPVVAPAIEEGDGVYRTDFVWSMGGSWILTLTAELINGRTVERVFQLDVGIPGE